MRRLEDVMSEIRYGNVLTIMNDDSIELERYSAYITKYNGGILMDVSEVEIGNFLEKIPNIKFQINNSTYYQLKYDYESRLYQSAIMYKVRQGGYKEPMVAEVFGNLVTENFDLIDSILDLDTKIANGIDKNLDKTKRKVS